MARFRPYWKAALTLAGRPVFASLTSAQVPAAQPADATNATPMEITSLTSTPSEPGAGTR